MEQHSAQNGEAEQKISFPGSEVIEPDLQIEHMRQAVKDNLSRKIQAMLNSCVNCGQCADSCHYYCSTGDSAVIPRNKIKTLERVLNTYFHPVKSRLPFLKPKDKPDEKMTTLERHLARLVKEGKIHLLEAKKWTNDLKCFLDAMQRV